MTLQIIIAVYVIVILFIKINNYAGHGTTSMFNYVAF